MTLAGYADEQKEFQRLVRQIVNDRDTLAAAREVGSAGCYGDSWRGLAEETGLAGVAVAEEYGGAGLPAGMMFVIAEELGRGLFAGPYLASCVMASSLLQTYGAGPECSELLEAIASGAVTATLAWVENPASWLVSGEVATRAAPADADADADAGPPAGSPGGSGGHRLDGVKRLVVDGATADVVLVLAAKEDGDLGLFAVETSAASVTATATETLDLTLRLAELRFEGARATEIPLTTGVLDAVERTLDLARLAVAATQVGAARRCLELSVDYAKTRHQFDKPIGTFQAVKHMCADMAVAVESAWTSVAFAVRSLESEPERLRTLSPLVSAYVCDVYRAVTRDTVHVHGGIGFTWEHDAHLYFKHAQSTSALFGTPGEMREILADRVGLTGSFTPIGFGDSA
ncbi:acyl-CoA dehydrogenase [Streptosporangium violaceochromogenes]|nr:acyl-CoA dehydrogenase [Streptosporangium violaceochromogenes]